jgi:hypothetical protein
MECDDFGYRVLDRIYKVEQQAMIFGGQKKTRMASVFTT